MKNGFSVFAQNTSQLNELFVWNCLERGDIDKFEQMLKEKMPLSAPMLSIMLYWGYKRVVIKEVLKIAEVVDNNIFPWMQEFFEVDEIADILPEYDELLPKDYPSNEDCVKLKLWKALLKRGRYDDLARNAPEVLETNGYISRNAYRALLKADFAKYADICYKDGIYSEILAIKDGWKYLVDHGKISFLFAYKSLHEYVKEADIIDYCLEKKLFSALFDAKMYDILLEHNQVDIFVQKHSTYSGFLNKCPEKVDWELLWNDAVDEDGELTFFTEKVRERLLKAARKHKNVPVCIEFLKNHGTWWEKFWL